MIIPRTIKIKKYAKLKSESFNPKILILSELNILLQLFIFSEDSSLLEQNLLIIIDFPPNLFLNNSTEIYSPMTLNML